MKKWTFIVGLQNMPILLEVRRSLLQPLQQNQT